MKDIMFILDEETGDVSVVQEAMQIPAVYDLWLYDKIGDKSFFRKVCKYTYHLYSRVHPLANLPEAERRELVKKSYFGGKFPRSFADNKRIIRFVDMYRTLQMGVEERLALKIKEAIAVEMERIANLELVTNKEIEIPYEASYDFDIYKKDKDKYVKIPDNKFSGVVKKRIEVYNTDLLVKEIEKAFKLSKQYDEALRRAAIEKEELRAKYDGMSLLEKYHAMEKEAQKTYLKAEL